MHEGNDVKFELPPRCGLIARKLGMSMIFDDSGNMLPVTVLKVERNVIVGIKTIAKNGYSALAIGYGTRRQKNMTKPLQGIAKRAGVESFMRISEFRITEEDPSLKLGMISNISHFSKGQLVDVTATSRGKGFAGPMKRHNFHGLEASHGVSVSHRAIGSTGNREYPGKVFKNKKMAGHLGDDVVTIQNLVVLDIDTELSLLVLKGAVPGGKGAIVRVISAVKTATPYRVNTNRVIGDVVACGVGR